MNIIQDFAEKHNGYYEVDDVKNVFSLLGRMVYQPKTAKFLIAGSKISINLNEVGGAIPTAEPYRITLRLRHKNRELLEIYPVTFFERIVLKLFPSKNMKLIKKYLFKGNEKLIGRLVKEKILMEKLQKQKVYIHIPRENTSKIILTPPNGIENAKALEHFIEVLKSIELNIKTYDSRRNY